MDEKETPGVVVANDVVESVVAEIVVVGFEVVEDIAILLWISPLPIVFVDVPFVVAAG